MRDRLIGPRHPTPRHCPALAQGKVFLCATMQMLVVLGDRAFDQSLVLGFIPRWKVPRPGMTVTTSFPVRCAAPMIIAFGVGPLMAEVAFAVVGLVGEARFRTRLLDRLVAVRGVFVRPIEGHSELAVLIMMCRCAIGVMDGEAAMRMMMNHGIAVILVMRHMMAVGVMMSLPPAREMRFMPVIAAHAVTPGLRREAEFFTFGVVVRDAAMGVIHRATTMRMMMDDGAIAMLGMDDFVSVRMHMRVTSPCKMLAAAAAIEVALIAGTALVFRGGARLPATLDSAAFGIGVVIVLAAMREVVGPHMAGFLGVPAVPLAFHGTMEPKFFGMVGRKIESVRVLLTHVAFLSSTSPKGEALDVPPAQDRRANADGRLRTDACFPRRAPPRASCAPDVIRHP